LRCHIQSPRGSTPAQEPSTPDHSPSMGLHGDTTVTHEILQVLTKDELKDLMKTHELTSAKKNCIKDGKYFVTLSHSQN